VTLQFFARGSREPCADALKLRTGFSRKREANGAAVRPTGLFASDDLPKVVDVTNQVLADVAETNQFSARRWRDHDQYDHEAGEYSDRGRTHELQHHREFYLQTISLVGFIYSVVVLLEKFCLYADLRMD